MSQQIFGYHNKLARVDLTQKTFKPETIDEDILKNFVGGAALGIKYLYDEVE